MLKIVPIKDTNVLLEVVASTSVHTGILCLYFEHLCFACCPVVLTYKTINLLYTIVYILCCFCFLWRFNFLCAILKNQ